MLLRGTVLLLGLLEDPGMGHVGDFCAQGQIVASKARRILPVLALRLEQPGQGDVVADAASVSFCQIAALCGLAGHRGRASLSSPST